MTGAHSNKIIGHIKKHQNTISTGTMVVIDPASRNVGYAIYENGVLIESGVLKAKDDSIAVRLADISAKLRRISKPEVLVIEEIRGQMSHIYLLWAVGAIIAALNPQVLLEMPISLWRSKRPAGYEKSDENDAVMIGTVVMDIVSGRFNEAVKGSTADKAPGTRSKAVKKGALPPSKKFSKAPKRGAKCGGRKRTATTKRKAK